MFVFSQSDNCSPLEVNDSISRHDQPYKDQEFYLMLGIIPVSFLAGAVNAFSLAVFLRQTFDNRAVHFSLLSISVAEVALQISVILEACIVLSGTEHLHSQASYFGTSLVHSLINAAFCVRNWNVVLISISRCEVVCLPFSTRSRLICSRHTLEVAQCIVVLLACVLAVLNSLHSSGLVCTNVNGLVVPRPLLSRYKSFDYYEMYGIFMYQSCLPVVLISISTLIIWLKLRQQVVRGPARMAHQHHHQQRERVLSSSTSEGLMRLHQQNHQSAKTTATLTSSCSSSSRQRNSSYLVLLFSLVFCLLQIPTFIITCLLLFSKGVQFAVHPDIFTNTLSVVDSLLNVFVYAASSRRFRSRAIDILFPGRRRSSGAGGFTNISMSQNRNSVV